MIRGLPILQLLMLIILLISVVPPFMQVAHARHARVLMVAMLGVTLILFLVWFLFGSHVSDRSDLVLLRCYAFSSATCTLVDELLSLRDAKAPIRVIPLVLFGLLFAFTLVCLIGGIYGAF